MNPSTIASPVSMCQRVQCEVARHEGVEPEQLSQELDEEVNTEALDKLLTAQSGQVTFTYCGYSVQATSAGVVTVNPTDL